MKIRLRQVLAYLVPFLLSIILLGYALRNISLQEINKPFQEANYFWLMLSIILGIISHGVRAYRWVLVLRPLGYSITVWQANVAVFSGYFANFLLPRAGEIARCTVVQRSSAIPIAVSVGTIITERVLDILILLFLLGMLLLIEAQNMTSIVWQFITQKIPQVNGYFNIFLLLILVAGVIGMLLIGYWARQEHHPIGQRIRKIGSGIWQGIYSLRYVERKLEFVLCSIFIWLLYYYMGYVLFFCFQATMHLDMWFAYIILIVGTIGMSAPVQGGAGAYHLLVGNLFALRNLTIEEGILLATFMHAAQLLVVLLLGGSAFLYSFWIYPKNKTR